MGMLADSLAHATAYRVKRDNPDLWPDLVDRIAGALLPAQLDEIEDELQRRYLDIPFGWHLEAAELIEQKREDLANEDVSQIMRDRFDF
jgi:ubiquinone biosynthesis protein Coq4